MRLTAKKWVGLVLVVLFILWWGIPTANKWHADRTVDELCAKDGGIKVYETVVLPKERFNQWEQFYIPGLSVMDGKHEFYRDSKNTNIRGRHEWSATEGLVIYQDHDQIYRSSDKKLLGESINYVRRGGDPIGPWMPSSYTCPGSTDDDLTKKIFLKSSTK